MKRIFLLIILIFLSGIVSAETIILRSGNVVEGEIVDRNDNLIKIDTSVGIKTTYYLDEIESIDGEYLKKEKSKTIESKNFEKTSDINESVVSSRDMLNNEILFTEGITDEAVLADDNQSMLEYVNKDYGVKFSYPSEWKVADRHTRSELFFAMGPSEEIKDFICVLSPEIDRAGLPNSLIVGEMRLGKETRGKPMSYFLEMTNSFVQKLPQERKENFLELPYISNIGNKEVVTYLFKIRYMGEERLSNFSVIYHGTVGYTFSLTVKPDKFDKQKRIVDYIISSVEFFDVRLTQEEGGSDFKVRSVHLDEDYVVVNAGTDQGIKIGDWFSLSRDRIITAHTVVFEASDSRCKVKARENTILSDVRVGDKADFSRPSTFRNVVLFSSFLILIAFWSLLRWQIIPPLLTETVSKILGGIVTLFGFGLILIDSQWIEYLYIFICGVCLLNIGVFRDRGKQISAYALSCFILGLSSFSMAFLGPVESFSPEKGQVQLIFISIAGSIITGIIFIIKNIHNRWVLKGKGLVASGFLLSIVLVFFIIISFSYDPSGHMNLGMQYHREGKYDQAITEYNIAIQQESQYMDVYFERGLAYAAKGNYTQAIADYTMTIDSAPTDIPTLVERYHTRAAAFSEIGEHEQARKDLIKAKELEAKYND